MTRHLAAAALAASVLTLAGTAAVADVHWVVHGVFDDGTPLTGFFDINVYDQLGAYQLETQAGPVLGAAVYHADSTNVGVSTIDFQPTYKDDLKLTFADSIRIGAAVDPLLTTSYECVNSYGCAGPSGGERRYIVGGFASAPEPAAWALMLIGVGGVGLSLRRRHGSFAR